MIHDFLSFYIDVSKCEEWKEADPQKLTFQPCVNLWLSCHKRNTHWL